MNLKRYEFFADEDELEYHFISVGPNGSIKKMVQFNPRHIDGVTYFNLGFGDWNEETEVLDDQSVTNNSDTKMILATIAAIVMAFAERFPNMPVYAIGSTPARTRLYQIAILNNWQEIEPVAKVYGYINNEWQPFKKGVNYEAFFVRKNNVILNN